MKNRLKSYYLRMEKYIRTHTIFVLGLTTLLLCAAILISQFIRLAKVQAESTNLVGQVAELQKEMSNAQLRYAALQDEKERLTMERNALVDDFLANNPLLVTDVEALQQSLGLGRVMAGATTVTGTGVSLLLSDPAGIDYATATAADIIHEQDVMNAVNLLKANGAVAMAVNGERLTATSKLICNGPTILVNRRLLSAPFVITAVGDMDQMLSAIQSDPHIEDLQTTGKTVQINATNEMIIPAFNDQVIIDKTLEMMKEVLES